MKNRELNFLQGLFTKTRFAILLISSFVCVTGLHAQTDIYTMMQRTDISLSEVETWADAYFAVNGTGKGSGYKQYQRWLYERKFHVDEKGLLIPPDQEDEAYYNATRKMGVASRSGYEWMELGPKSWNHTSSWNPGVGRITSVAVHPSNEAIIYICSPGGGIWKSVDGGSDWSPLIDFVNSSWMDVYNLCIDPSNPDVVYAGLSSGGVIKSSDAGNTWAATGSGPTTSRRIRVHPSNSNIVFAAGSNGLWRSVNAGANWTKVETSTKEDIEFNPADPNIMYASGSGGTQYVWRSTDNGITWTGIDTASGIYKSGRTLIAVAPSDPSVVYVLQAKGSLFGYFYRSDDTGKTYKTMLVGDPTKGTGFFGYDPAGFDNRGQANHDMALVVNPLDAEMVHFAGILCWRSDDGGSSFQATTNWTYPNSLGYNHADVHALEYVNDKLFSGSDGGIYVSDNDGEDWADLSSGLGIKQFYRIATSKTDPDVISGGAQDNGSSYRQPGGQWVDWLGADGMDCLISPTDPSIGYGTSQNGSIYKTTNYGNSQVGLTKPSTGNWVTPLAIHPRSHDTLWGGWTGVYRSDDGGNNWNKIASTISVTLDVLAVAPSDPSYIYASKGSTLYRLTENGDKWTSVTAPATITSIFVSKLDPMKIWVTCNSSSIRVLVSYNGGTNFTNISAGLPNMAARTVVVDEDTTETIYVGMNIGVYFRDSISNSWAEQATGLPFVAVNELEIQKSSGKLRVATYGRGVWESYLRNVKVTCGKPSNASAREIGVGEMEVSWGKVLGSEDYHVEYKLLDDTAWTVVQSSTPALADTIAGLEPGTMYQWRVRSNCSGDSSAYAASVFTTSGTSKTHALAGLTDGLLLYPDPAAEYLNLKWVFKQEGRAEIRIMDATGRVVLGSVQRGLGGSNQLSLDIATLAPGRYHIQVSNASELRTAVFVIAR